MKIIQDLLNIINQKKTIKVVELEKITNIPRTSLLRYLKKLENEGKVVKFYGEVSIRKSSIESHVLPRINSYKKEKMIIAKKAVVNIKDGDVVFLDAGSTTYYLACQLANKNVTIYTNNILLSNIINHDFLPIVYFLPGKINSKTLSISSTETILSINQKRFDKCFIGVNSFDQKHFFTTNQEEAIVKKTVINSTNKNHIYILGRSQKSTEKAKFIFANYKNSILVTEKGGD